MAKDPAFLFYYQDFLVGTDDFSNEEVGAYVRCLCMQAAKGGISDKHMMNICKTHEVHNSIKKKFIFDDDNQIYKNLRLYTETEKRKNYSNSRRDNRLGNKSNSNISSSYVSHMENENIIVLIRELEDNKGFVLSEAEKEKFMFLVLEMAKIFKEKNPEYFFDKEHDYSACLKIAYKIAEMKKWKKAEVIGAYMKECLDSWRIIVDFIFSDEWFRTRSLSHISSVKEWQSLVQKMNAKKKPVKRNLNSIV